jgi:hypothetical protein
VSDLARFVLNGILIGLTILVLEGVAVAVALDTLTIETTEQEDGK